MARRVPGMLIKMIKKLFSQICPSPRVQHARDVAKENSYSEEYFLRLFRVMDYIDKRVDELNIVATGRGAGVHMGGGIRVKARRLDEITEENIEEIGKEIIQDVLECKRECKISHFAKGTYVVMADDDNYRIQLQRFALDGHDSYM